VKIIFRIILVLAGLVVLAALFYAEEDWRGKRAWEKCKAELEAKGEVLDWNAYIPPPVPDDQNFFKTPKMANWFVTLHTLGSPAFIAENKTNELGQHLDPQYPFEVASRNGSNGSVMVAELFLTSLASPETGLRFDDPAAGAQIHRLIEDVIGQSVNGAQGLTLSAKTLNQIKPEQIRVQASKIPSADEVAAFLHVVDVATNVGPLRVEAGLDSKSFRVFLVPRPSISAADYLAWNKQADANFDLIREALKQAYARIDGDYSQPFSVSIPNFVMMRSLAQTLAQRTQCYLLLGQPEKALHELTLINDSRHLLTGRPMPLVSAMINVAIVGLYVTTIADGMRLQAWQEPQLAAIQEQLKEINLSPLVAESFKSGRASTCYTLETTTAGEFGKIYWFGNSKLNLLTKIKSPSYLLFAVAPHGWIYQNMVAIAISDQNILAYFDLTNNLILTHKPREVGGGHQITISQFSPLTFLAAMSIPNFTKALQTLARNQTRVNQAQIVCALERYHLAHGEYPTTLDALAPQFIEKIPHDIIGGQPLHYRRTNDPPSQSSGAASGKFLLYSVGWNETDDGGQDIGADFTKGDWVWKN
jgi:hypothetical protein